MNTKRIMMGITVLGLSVSVFAANLKVGDAAPAIEAQDQDGKPWKLSEKLSKKYLVIYFYPAAMTGGCTKQACAYRDYLKGAGDAFDVVGISGDPVQNLKYFQQAEQLNFTLLSDADGAIAKAYGVPVKKGEKSIVRSVDGKEVTLTRGTTIARWTFVIDPAGNIVFRDDQAKPTQDLADILKFIKNASE